MYVFVMMTDIAMKFYSAQSPPPSYDLKVKVTDLEILY